VAGSVRNKGGKSLTCEEVTSLMRIIAEPVSERGKGGAGDSTSEGGKNEVPTHGGSPRKATTVDPMQGRGGKTVRDVENKVRC